MDHRIRTLLVGAVGYLALSVVVWWHVWTANPTSVTTCGCGDSSLFTWFLAWPAHALAHGTNPLFSTALFHPAGTNLLSNTAEVGIGIVFAPLTWAFGPVATLNVALTLAPALSALAMYVLLRRWVNWAPAAFIGGLLYGFSPFILVSGVDAHLMLSMSPIPPLVVACLDEMLVRQRHRAVVTGGLLGVLVAVQFFVGTELLVITAITAAIGVVLVVAYACLHREILRSRARHAVVATAAALGTGVALLAYPVWFTFAGPGHLAGPIWGPQSAVSYGGTQLRDFVLPAPLTSVGYLRRLGGYQGSLPSGQYVGIGLVVVLFVGLVVWRADLRLWLFVAVGAISLSLSLALRYFGWTPWRMFIHLPLMENIIPSRFVLITYLCAAVMLGLIVDHARTGVARWWRTRSGDRTVDGGGRWRLAGGVAGVVVALVALVPVAGYEAEGLPLTTQQVVVPPWFRHVAPHLKGHQVLLVFPYPNLLQSAMTWQAVEGMPFDMVGGGGPGSLATRAGQARPGLKFLAALAYGAGSGRYLTTADVAAVRHAVDTWGVTMVVIPDPTGQPLYQQFRLTRTAVTVMTAVTGRLPVRQDHAWVWSDVSGSPPPVLVSTTRLNACDAGPSISSDPSLFASAACVLRGTGTTGPAPPSGSP